MSSAPGRRRSPKRSASTSTVEATSSSESVVWLITASGLPFVSSRSASSGDSTTTICSGRSPFVPITSTWSRWPTSATRWPLSAYRRASACTFETSGQTASTTRKPATLAVLEDRRRDPVRREHADRALRHLVLVVDEHGAEPFEAAHDVVVVDDVVADVDRGAVLLEQPLDDLDRPVDAGAERARRGEEDAPAHGSHLAEGVRARADVARALATCRGGSQDERLQEARSAAAGPPA